MWSLTRSGYEQGLHLRWSGLLSLVSFSSPFNLASGGVLAAPPLATVGIHPLELREVPGDWSLYFKKCQTERPLCLGFPQGPAQSQLQ